MSEHREFKHKRREFKHREEESHSPVLDHEEREREDQLADTPNEQLLLNPSFTGSRNPSCSGSSLLASECLSVCDVEH